MAAFEYEAVTGEGAKTTGILEADSSAEARQDLRNMGLFPIEVTSISGHRSRDWSFRQVRIAGEAMAIMTRQLATLLDSGLPLDDSLAAVARQSAKPAKKILSDLRAKVREGQSLASAMEAYPKTFSPLYRASIMAGEASGNLAKVMDQLANYLEDRSASEKKIALALVYPMILCIVSICVVVGLLVWVIPGLVETVVDAGQELPALTVALINISEFLLNYGIHLIAALSFIWFALLAMTKNRSCRQILDRFVLGIPLIASTLQDRASSRYTGTLGILTASGIPLLQAMELAESTSSNSVISRNLETITQQVHDGAQLAMSMEKSRLFSEMVIQLVAVGERGGSLAAMLLRASRMQDDLLQRRTATFVALIEPLTLLIMGAIVMAIVLAVMLPILNFNQLIQ